MALGGGTFLVQNKILPGTYINFASAASSNPNLSDRGIATMPLELDWGIDDEVFEVTNEDFQKNSLEIFGYPYTHEKLKGLRDLFLNIKTLYAYKLTSGGVKASNTFAEALYSGKRGNNIKIAIQKNVDYTDMFDVKTVFDNIEKDKQTVKTAAELKANAFVKFKEGAQLAATAATPLTGGTNGAINGTAYQNYLNKIESYSFNTMGVVVTDDVTKALFNSFTKRLRDETGVKFQLVLYRYSKADYIGTISVKNKVLDVGENEASLVYWVTGVSAGYAVNKSNQNRQYNGAFTVDTNYSQPELAKAITSGEFVLHNVNKDVKVLEDINTFVSVTKDQGDVFKDNKTVRIIDQMANDTAVLFATKYMGKIPNNKAGKDSLWSDIVTYYGRLENLEAIENFDDKKVIVSKGDVKNSVVVNTEVEIVGTMTKLYMSIVVA